MHYWSRNFQLKILIWQFNRSFASPFGGLVLRVPHFVQPWLAHLSSPCATTSAGSIENDGRLRGHVCWSDVKLTTKFKFKFVTDADTSGRVHVMDQTVNRSRTTLKFWSATMFGAAARNFGPVHKFELPTVIADSVPRATRVFSLASVGHVTGHMVSHMVPMARCRPPNWKIFTVNNLATVF